MGWPRVEGARAIIRPGAGANVSAGGDVSTGAYVSAGANVGAGAGARFPGEHVARAVLPVEQVIQRNRGRTWDKRWRARREGG